MLPHAKAPMMASATSTMGAMVDSMPVPRPSMMTVAAPVSAASAILWTGLYLSEQKYSVILPMARPATRPQTTEPNSQMGCASADWDCQIMNRQKMATISMPAAT